MRLEKGLLPVVAVGSSPLTATRDLTTIRGCGCQQCFVVDHHFGRDYRFLRRVVESLRDEYADTVWIGVNYLDLQPLEAVREVGEADGIWNDHLYVVLRRPHQKYAIDVHKAAAERSVTLFGSVAYRTHPDPGDDLAALVGTLAPWVDVVTISGPKADVPPSVEKVAICHQATLEANRNGCLAVAGGARAHNVQGLVKAGADYLLCNTGIRDEGDGDRGAISSRKLQQMLELVAGVGEA